MIGAERFSVAAAQRPGAAATIASRVLALLVVATLLFVMPALAIAVGVVVFVILVARYPVWEPGIRRRLSGEGLRDLQASPVSLVSSFRTSRSAKVGSGPKASSEVAAPWPPPLTLWALVAESVGGIRDSASTLIQKLRADARWPNLGGPRFDALGPSPRDMRVAIRGAVRGFRAADLLVLALVLVGVGLRVNGAFVGGDVADVSAYNGHVQATKQGLSVYRESSYPYLPGWLMVELASASVAEALKVPFWQVIRLVIVAADVLVIFAVWALATRASDRRRGRIAAGIYALSPIAILVAGHHGMFDSIPILLTLLAAGLATAGSRRIFLTGLLFGLAMTLKPLAVLALPLFLLARRWTFYQRIGVCTVAGLVLLAACAPVLISDPPALFRNVLGYGGVNDQGIGGLFRAMWFTRSGNWYLPGEFGRVISDTTRTLTLALMALTVFICWRMDLMRLAAAVYIAFLISFGAVSTQYLLWPLPFLLVCGAPLALGAAYALGTAAGAVGFYMLYWPPILFGGGAPTINFQAGPHFLAGQAVSLVVMIFTYVATIWPGLSGGRWRTFPVVLGVALTILSGVPAGRQAFWLLQEWAKIPR